MTKKDHIFRNYTNDRPLMYKEVYSALCDGFDELQKDFCGVQIVDRVA